MTTTSNQGSSDQLLVFGDDGSSAADTAWEWINSHSWPGWRVEVVTASEPSLAAPTVDDDPVAVDWDPPKRRETRPSSEIAAVRHVIAASDPRLLLGNRRDADLLVIGSRGLSPVRAILLGSTTEWLLEQPPAPMAVVRHGGPTRQTLILADGSESALTAVDAFVDMPWAAQSDVVVLSVDDGRTDVSTAQVATLQRLAGGGIDASVVQATGRPTAVILERLEKTHPQLVVLGTRGLGGLDRLRLGSTAAAVIRHGGCTVMVGRYT